MRAISRVSGVIHSMKSGAAVQPGSTNDAMRVCQLNDPSAGMYWLVYQNVQSSAGSTDRLL